MLSVPNQRTKRANTNYGKKEFKYCFKNRNDI